MLTPPTGVSATDGTSAMGVTVMWNSVSGATSYNIWRGVHNASGAAEKIGTVTGTSYTDSSVEAGKQYWYWIEAVNSSYSSGFTAWDTGYRKLGSPSGVSATAGTGANNLTWSAVADATSYKILRGTSSTYSSATQIGTVTTATYSDATALPGQGYYYWVVAVNDQGESAPSSYVYTSGWQLAAPTGVSASDGTYYDKVVVSWGAVTGASAYYIYRYTSNSSGSASQIGSSTTTSYEDKTAVAGTTYYYWVKAYNADSKGYSAFSAVDSGVRAIKAPTNVTASDNTLAVGIRIVWDAVNEADSYVIYRGTSSSSGSATQIGTSMGPAYIDSEVSSGTTYYYFIKAIASDLGVTSAFSAYDTGSRKAGEPLYVVVDLSDGTTAASYPISELSAIPSGGWSDEYKTNKLVLRSISSGTFTMGGHATDYPGACDINVHSVTISKPFYMGVFEVTQKQYELVMGTRPSVFANESCYMTRPVEAVSYDMLRGSSEGAKWPSANTVDSTSFMGKIRSRTGLPFDLPTEAQWEYACRAGTTTALNCGKNLKADNYDVNLKQLGRYLSSYGWNSDLTEGTAAVGSYLANAWGLYDMHGNVHEWCLDWYQSSLGAGAVTDPKGATSGLGRVMRGGCIIDYAKACISAARSGVESNYPCLDCFFGFRLCCPAGEATDQVTVSFNANGGTGIMSAASVGNGGSMVVPECTFYKSGCVFAGWATSFSGGVVYEAGATIPGVTSALTLYAKWVTPSKTYLVVDLAAGSDAAGYPMSEMSAEPNGGWADEYKTNKLVLRRIANGAYLMGGASTEIGYLGDEAKQHQVTITKPFYMGVFEVTQKQYELVMGSNPSAYKGDARPVECVSYNTIRGSSDGAMWPSANAVDSTSFMGKIRARTGLTFDLPTEAQWEYACRAGTTTALNSGKNLTSTGGDSNMEEVGRYYYSTDRTYDEYSQHAVVGSYLPNNWGLYDMHGNVWECCLDWYVSRGTSGFDFEAVSDPKGAASGSRRVIRGGGWSYSARYCRSAYRASRDPSNENNDLGFRLCCPAE